MVDRHTLEEQLEMERKAKQYALEQMRVLQRELEEIRHDVKRRENELEMAQLSLRVYEEEVEVQDLVEHNIALREQVQSLKALVEQIQSGQSTARIPLDGKRRTGSVGVIGDRLRRSTSDITAESPDELISRNEVQQLLAKLAVKESQLQLLHQKCASWEQQVIELKFEVQSVKHAAQEQADVARIAQHSIIRQECCAVCKSKSSATLIQALKLEKKALASAISPRAPRTDLEHYKSLSHLRGVFWLEALEKTESLAKKLAEERKTSSALRMKMQEMEHCHQGRAVQLQILQSKLESALSCCDVLKQQFGTACSDNERLLAEVKHLRLELDSERCQRKADKVRSARIILDLRGELNKSLLDLEQLHNASVLFSPKNSRGIDSNRKSFAHANPAA